MATEQTSEEVEQQYVEAMGVELGRLYHRLWTECIWLHFKWEDYETLFGTSPERIEILNSSASAFFWMLQDALWKDVLLHLCRLTDSPRSFNKQNLTLNRLPSMVDPAIRQRTEAVLAEANKSTGFARDWRVRHIAHSDLDLALKETSVKPLEAGSRRDVKIALKAIAAVLNVLESHYTNTPVCYDFIGPRPHSALGLLYVLRDGLKARKAADQRLIAGELLPEDFVREEPI